MGLSIGIVGLPNVGKSTLFNALTENEVLAANYPFATIEPNVGVVEVPDDRLAVLAGLYDAPKAIHASVTFLDIAGIVRGASDGEGLGNQFLAAIRETDAICEVVRAFVDDDVVHVDGRLDPEGDISTVETELILADLQTVDKAIPRLERDAKRAGGTSPKLRAVSAARAVLDDGRTIAAASRSLEMDELYDLHLLTAKPCIYAFNVDEATLADGAARERLVKLAAPAPSVVLCAKLESELAGLDPADAAALLAEYGQLESGLAQLARVGFDTLGLHTFLTAGPKEARAWTIRKGAMAPEAAGVIHSDFETHFIKAEVVSYDDLVAAGSIGALRAAGKARIEGRDYVVQEGDVIEFRVGV
jgi:ribosome-binding ATPase